MLQKEREINDTSFIEIKQVKYIEKAVKVIQDSLKLMTSLREKQHRQLLRKGKSLEMKRLYLFICCSKYNTNRRNSSLTAN